MENVSKSKRLSTLFFSMLYISSCTFGGGIVIVSLMKKDKPHQETKAHRFAVLIAARNEETVINHLIDSINTQT